MEHFAIYFFLLLSRDISEFLLADRRAGLYLRGHVRCTKASVGTLCLFAIRSFILSLYFTCSLHLLVPKRECNIFAAINRQVKDTPGLHAALMTVKQKRCLSFTLVARQIYFCVCVCLN